MRADARRPGPSSVEGTAGSTSTSTLTLRRAAERAIWSTAVPTAAIAAARSVGLDDELALGAPGKAKQRRRSENTAGLSRLAIYLTNIPWRASAYGASAVGGVGRRADHADQRRNGG